VTQEEAIGRVVEALVRLGIPYMVAGSFASNLHGVPRMTQDADLVIDVDDATVVRLVRTLEADFYVSEDAAREAVRLRRMFNVIHLARGFARVRCAACGDELLVAFSCKNRGVCPSCTTRRVHDTAADLVECCRWRPTASGC